MNPIYKYALQEAPNYYGSVTNVRAGKILFVAEQDGILHAWVEVDASTNALQKLRVFATGEKVDASQEHVGSAKVGPFVWHVYKQV